ncbi:NADH dehydrogenase [ubiquinone] 1 alpha subcomplex assembly factor 3 [Hylaeus anthracinus]|uniref:NADH dehydrogenase [ubiquinone] 1 alpha subcomplex assembly factor 3 n=1 Tax=Hylaeus anthracinus TaxID=313031 RepID=UPI0023BA0397|nr:NADH dehydrogenase [ubiquinone] 1 alpha subcomplex assembly factor 3 [Hylaeus anthracinus]
MNLDDRENILIDKCTPIGFFFNNKTAMMGPLVIFPKTILCWNVSSGNDINKESLSLFTALEPKPDIVVIGLETQYEYSKIVKMKEVLHDKQINVEVLPTDIACGIYNFLCNEGRYVGAALIPPLRSENPILKRLKSNMSTIQKQKLIES